MVRVKFTYESRSDRERMLKALGKEFKIKKVSKEYESKGVSHKRTHIDLEARA